MTQVKRFQLNSNLHIGCIFLHKSALMNCCTPALFLRSTTRLSHQSLCRHVHSGEMLACLLSQLPQDCKAASNETLQWGSNDSSPYTRKWGLQTMSSPCTMCCLCYTRHGIAGPCFATDTLLHLHHARLSVCHAVCWPATACHGKGSHVSTSTDRRVHLGKVLGLNGVQRLPHVMWHADICHL